MGRGRYTPCRIPAVAPRTPCWQIHDYPAPPSPRRPRVPDPLHASDRPRRDRAARARPDLDDGRRPGRRRDSTRHRRPPHRPHGRSDDRTRRRRTGEGPGHPGHRRPGHGHHPGGRQDGDLDPAGAGQHRADPGHHDRRPHVRLPAQRPALPRRRSRRPGPVRRHRPDRPGVRRRPPARAAPDRAVRQGGRPVDARRRRAARRPLEHPRRRPRRAASPGHVVLGVGHRGHAGEAAPRRRASPRSGWTARCTPTSPSPPPRSAPRRPGPPGTTAPAPTSPSSTPASTPTTPTSPARSSTRSSFVPGRGHRPTSTATAPTSPPPIAGTGAASGGDEQGRRPGRRPASSARCSATTGSGQDSWVIAGMEWAADQGADVVNMSLGDSEATDGTDPMCQAVDDALGAARRAVRHRRRQRRAAS